MKRILAILTALLCMCSFACAESTETTDWKAWLESDVAQPISQLFAEGTMITTVGAAVPAAAIDTAVVAFAMDASGATVAEANDVITANIATLKETLAAHGVKQEDIWHKTYDVSPNVVYHNTRVTDKQVIEGYVVEISLNVRLEDISLVGVVIDAVMSTGTGSTPELILECSQAALAYETALAQAAQQAMDKAVKLAESCGMELGELVSVKEISVFGDSEARVEVVYSAK